MPVEIPSGPRPTPTLAAAIAAAPAAGDAAAPPQRCRDFLELPDGLGQVPSAIGLTAADVRRCDSTGVSISIAYDTFGELNAPRSNALLLTAGLGGNRFCFADTFCRLLAAPPSAGGHGFFVVRYDNRDVGHSTKLEECGDPPFLRAALTGECFGKVKLAYTLGDMADDAAALIRRLGLPAAHIYGSSMGGMIAQEVLLRHPGLVSSVCSFGSSSGAKDVEDATLWSKAQFLRRPASLAPADIVSCRLGWFQAVGCGRKFTPADRLYLEAVLYTQELIAPYRNYMARQATAVTMAEPRDPALCALPPPPPAAAAAAHAVADAAEKAGARLAPAPAVPAGATWLAAGHEPAGTAAAGTAAGTAGNRWVPVVVVHGTDDRVIPPARGLRTAACVAGCAMVLIDGMGHTLMPPFFSPVAAAIRANADRALFAEKAV